VGATTDILSLSNQAQQQGRQQSLPQHRIKASRPRKAQRCESELAVTKVGKETVKIAKAKDRDNAAYQERQKQELPKIP
jgi:hypothetical protein